VSLNKYAQASDEADFDVRHGLTALIWRSCSRGPGRTSTSAWRSAIRRIGFERWLRNLAVGLGNAEHGEDIVAALDARRADPSPLVREHVAWALREQERKRAAA
jgi:epoxyqueuosine reductase